jgi:hypothetical protein
MTFVLISCAGDSDLAKRVFDFLISAYPSKAEMISLDEAEVTIRDKTSGIKNIEVRAKLSKFQTSNTDLTGYSITEFGNIFTIGILQTLDKLVFSCEMCGYLARYEEDLINHKKIIHSLIGFSWS